MMASCLCASYVAYPWHVQRWLGIVRPAPKLVELRVRSLALALERSYPSSPGPLHDILLIHGLRVLATLHYRTSVKAPQSGQIARSGLVRQMPWTRGGSWGAPDELSRVREAVPTTEWH